MIHGLELYLIAKTKKGKSKECLTHIFNPLETTENLSVGIPNRKPIRGNKNNSLNFA